MDENIFSRFFINEVENYSFFFIFAKPQSEYTEGFNFQTTSRQDVELMMQYYMKSSEDEAYKRIADY